MDVSIVEQFGMLYSNGWKPKKIMQELGIDYATYRKLFKEWKKQKEKEKYRTKEEYRKEKDKEKDTEEEYQEENDQEVEEPEENQEKESYNESNEEKCYRNNESQKESKNQSINQVRDNVINKELEDFFDNDELNIKENSNDDENEDDDYIEKIIGDAKETILFFIGLWLFLLAVKYPGDLMEKLDFVNSFIEKRERQIKRMVEKIDNVLRNYTKLYNMLAKANDWTFLMDMAIITITFKSELDEKFLTKYNEEKKDNKKENTEYMELHEEKNNSRGFNGRLSLLLGGEEYAESIQ